LNANDALAARSARKSAAAALGAVTDDPEVLAAAELIVGELLANAARHADGHVCLELTVNEGFVHLCVHDASPAFAIDIRPPADELSESGRGLYIISKLADRIDVEPVTNVGKCVSVRLNLPTTASDPFELCSRHWLRGGGKVCMAPLLARYPSQPGLR
jgi:anti-sigma regulatory factor (Ser/Thr protein kinase)